jgi:hypothetical protein
MMAAALDQSQRDSLAAGSNLDSVSITPPQSATGKKEAPEGVPSDLSDLELDLRTAPEPDTAKIKIEEIEEKPEEVEEIEPDHYYGGGKVPVFKPVSTMQLPGCLSAQRWKFWLLRQTGQNMLYIIWSQTDRGVVLDDGPVP